ncbi:MAG: class I SAM-dependent methyltransferase [Pseudomonadota bacterium]
MERNSVGKAPRQPRLEDDSYADYLTQVRNFAIREWFPEVAGQLVAGAGAAGLPDAGASCDYSELAPVVDSLPAANSWKRVMRSQQRMTWDKSFESYSRDRQHWVDLLDRAEQNFPGRLHRDESLVVPDSACENIHLQPGGYCRDELAGFVFHHGTNVFYQGDNDHDELHDLYADMLRQPADGQLSRIVDLGCSIGQCTTALKTRHPDADIWGLDIGLPLLRYAHLRATELGSDVHFQHALAEATPFEDSSVDAVFAYILFHEVPQFSFEEIVAEVRRILRPGGTFTVIDAPNGTNFPAPNRMWLAFDAQYNCEPYSPAFVASDFKGLLESQHFEQIEQGPTPTFLSMTTAVKPE